MLIASFPPPVAAVDRIRGASPQRADKLLIKFLEQARDGRIGRTDAERLTNQQAALRVLRAVTLETAGREMIVLEGAFAEYVNGVDFAMRVSRGETVVCRA